ncbi:hypothetical protein ABFS82_12G004700 [Erythranthe guttata]
MACSSSESRPEKGGFNDQKEFHHLNGMAVIVARTLIQLFGDEGINYNDQATTPTIVAMKKKKGKYSNYYRDAKRVERVVMKKPKYRSIHNLYMTTKPIKISEGMNKFCS